MCTKKVCPRCKREFFCLSNENCFCNHYKLNDKQERFLRVNYQGCLCEQCLKEFAIIDNPNTEKHSQIPT